MRVGKASLLVIMPNMKNPDDWLEPLNAAMEEGGINTPKRQAAFIAQLAHESGEFKYVREIWGPTETQRGYEGRADLGNTEVGDGSRFRGRGLIQITGRANYVACGKALGLPLADHPEMLELPSYAAKSAVWFWNSRSLNELADREAFKEITKKINGGYNGWADRKKYYERAQAVLY